MTRPVKLLVELLLTLVFALGVLVVVTGATPLGTGLLAAAIDRLAGGTLTTTGLAGTLFGGVTATRVSVRLDTVAIDIDDVELAVGWPRLAGGELRLTTARAAALRVHVTPDPDAPDERVPPLVLPVAITVDGLAVERVAIQLRDDPPLVFTAARFAGRLERGDLAIDALGVQYGGIGLGAGGRIGTGEPWQLATDIAVRWPDAGVAGRGQLAGSLARLRLAAEFAVPETVQVSGTARLLDDTPDVRLALRSATLQRPVDAARELRLDDVRLDVTGWLDDLRAAVSLKATLTGLPPAVVTARARGTPDRLLLEPVTVLALGGRTTATGELRLSPALAGAFRFRGERLDPAVLDARASGRIDAIGDATFTADGNFRVRIERAAGTLLRQRFAARGSIARQGGEWRADAVRVAAGPNRLEMDGRWGTGISGRFRVVAPELARVWPGLRGSLAGRGEVDGTLARPTLKVDLEGDELAFDDLAMRSLTVRGGVVRRDRIDLTVAARGLAVGPDELGDLDASARGRLADHDLSVRLAGGSVEIGIAGNGRVDAAAFRGAITSAMVGLPGDFRWQLVAPAALRIAATDDVTLGAHCWASGAARLCLDEARVRGSAIAVAATLRDLDLARLAPWLPPELSLTGQLDADVDGGREAGRFTGTLRVAPRDAAVRWSFTDDEPVATAITTALLEVDATSERVDYRADLADGFGLTLAARGRITAPFAAEPGIEGTLTGGIADLATLSPLADQLLDVAGLAGSVSIDALLTGPLRAPTITGGLKLIDAALTVPVAGIAVDRINVEVSGGAGGRATVLGGARSGKGFVQLTGDLAWEDDLVPATRLLLRGRLFEVLNLPAAEVQVSPDVSVELVAGQFRVGGELLVPRARIRPKQLDSGAVTPSPDAIVHGRETIDRGRGRPLFVLDGLRVRLGKDIRFEGFGLKADVKGAFTLYQNLPDDPFAITGDGVVELDDGEFMALGQKLAIERGSLRFAGLVTDPGIDVKASRSVVYQGRSLTVGVLLSGLLSRIETRVFSEPAMGEMDALSFLTTGRPLAAATAGDRLSVANAALALGMRGAMPIAQQLGDALRVDEIGVEGTGGDNTAVFVGERFGEDLYVRYSYGIFDQVGTIRATYRLGRRVSIEGASGEAQAIDLIYSITW